MTCEIVIMNLNAVALAADSAMTVTKWVNGQKEQRFFKGSNKIFQVSNFQPVALMVFGTASLQGVPWELIIKEFRAHLKTSSYPQLRGYSEALFDYIRGHPTLFPPARRKEIFVDEVDNTALALFHAMSRALKLNEKPANDDEKKKTIDQYLDHELAAVGKDALPPLFPSGADDKALTDYKNEIDAAITNLLDWAKRRGRLHPDREIDPAKMAVLVLKTLFRRYSKLMSASGIVVAGYGEQDLYPGYHEFAAYGFLLDYFLYDDAGGNAASLSAPAVIKPFATTGMVETFLLGFSDEVYTHVMSQFQHSMKGFSEEIRKEVNVPAISNLDAHMDAAFKAYQEAWTRKVADAHFRPLQEVVASLPVDEMAELAETLVSLQSLKEKVTSPTESVGGPVDVAIVTKHEGLIWISRKHYFDPEKNPRYFMRQRLQY
jgi:hypothetical protein